MEKKIDDDQWRKNAPPRTRKAFEACENRVTNGAVVDLFFVTDWKSVGKCLKTNCPLIGWQTPMELNELAWNG